jgi:hypothetical protein
MYLCDFMAFSDREESTMASIDSKCNSDTSAWDVVVEMTSFIIVGPCVDVVPKFGFEREDNSWELNSSVVWYKP